jgi:UDP-N-acetylmuramate dehydrogenase
LKHYLIRANIYRHRGTGRKPVKQINDLKNTLSEFRDINFDENVPARNFTSYCIGGNVRFVITINSPDSASKVLSRIHEMGLRIHPLGAGTNILVSNSGFDGVFIRLGENFKKIERTSEGCIRAGAAVKLTDLVDYCVEGKLGGLAFLSGIPGTVGGAVAMNAGAFGDEMRNHVESVHAVAFDGNDRHLTRDDCHFEYRNSIFRKDKMMVLDAKVCCIPKTDIKTDVESNLEHRSKKHVVKGRYAGSVFKNPEGDYAGRLLDDAGMKGLRVGSAIVSVDHANFILADKDASADDVLELMQIGALRVYTFWGVKLYPEVELIGFDLDWDEIFNP